MLLVGGYREAFLVMLAPLFLLLLVLFHARRTFPQVMPKTRPESGGDKLGKSLKWYNLFVFISAAGLLPWSLLAYHMKQAGTMVEQAIPLAYALAMMADALSAYPIGVAFDRMGFVSLSICPLLSVLVSLAFLRYPACLVGVVAYGLVLGIYETIMRAGVAKLVPLEKRGLAYGTFESVYGFSFLLGNSLAGLLYEYSISLVVLYVLLAETLSLLALAKVMRLKE
jgi:hypothetical protein